jgi:hypothetical protein
MKVLVACELYGRVRDAFIAKGHDAWSCDIYWTNGNHIHDDVLNHLNEGWDLMIAHPPCTYLAVSGARWFSDRMPEQTAALTFVRALLSAPIPKIALENPIGVISTNIRKPDQIIDPWQFGHGTTKATCLWLKNLPLLKPTNIVNGRFPEIHYMPKSSNRGRLRSITPLGIAQAMANQWGNNV